jgi:hypothetical protein
MGSATLVNVTFQLTTVAGDYSEGTTILSPESPLKESGSFTATVTGLTPKTTYYYRATAQGTGNRIELNELSFTTK